MKRYTWRDYWKSQEGMSLFWVDWNYYSATYRWWDPRRHKIGGKLWEMWYYVRCFLWKRYSTVTPRFLPPTWCDRDNLLLHTSFEILMDYVENEHKHSWTVADLEKELAKPVEDYQDEMSRAWCESALPYAKEIELLYKWWTVDRPAREAEAGRRLDAWHKLWKRDLYRFRDANKEFWEERRKPQNGTYLWEGSVPQDDSWISPELVDAEALKDQLSDQRRDEEDDEMLRRLIAVRHSMWT